MSQQMPEIYTSAPVGEHREGAGGLATATCLGGQQAQPWALATAHLPRGHARPPPHEPNSVYRRSATLTLGNHHPASFIIVGISPSASLLFLPVVLLSLRDLIPQMPVQITR